jgi:exo beta-1,2-glucooligosaccharide sophorohydrolase (non-reducing end)
VMIENYRSGLIWKLFMSHPEIQPMLDKIGFRKDSTPQRAR